MCVRLRFGCSLRDDTHTAAFDTAGGSEEEQKGERKGETQGLERRQEWQNKNMRRRDDCVCSLVCMFDVHICVCTACSIFPCENVRHLININIMPPICVQYACVHLHPSLNACCVPVGKHEYTSMYLLSVR